MGAPILEHPAHASRSGQDSYVSKGGLLSGQCAGMITKQNLTKYGALSLTSSKFLLLKNKDIKLKGLDEFIASFCRLGGKSQSQQIVNEYLKTRK